VEVEKLRREYDIQVDWQPFLLRPQTPPEGLPLPDYVRERMRDPDDPLKRRAARAGLTLVHRELIPSTRRAHEAAEHARAHGLLEPFHAALLRRYWSEGQDLWSLDVLKDAAREVGLDPDALGQDLESRRYEPGVAEALRQAREAGVEAVPTFLVGERFVIRGAQEYPTFRHALERLGARPRAAP
jgi:predicted DsbA family dithiol-disulfide isomerase